MQIKWVITALSTMSALCINADASRILAILPTPSRSHHIWNRALTLALAKRGHQVTVLSPDPEKEAVPNYRHFNLEGSYERIQELRLERMANKGHLESLIEMVKWGVGLCKHQTNTKGFKELLKIPQDSFDLILMEITFFECMYLFIHHFGGGTRIPVIGMTSFGTGPWTDSITGARTMPSVFALPVLPLSSHMNFWERLTNTIVTGISVGGKKYFNLPEQQKIADEAYGKPLPPLEEIGQNISLIFVNNHYAINGPQAQLPSIIEVAGMHCSPPNPLPEDIKTFLDESERGVVYFSLGTNLRSEVLPEERLNTIIDTFSALGPKIRVLWKFDPDVPIENLPENVLLRKWLPQEDLLGHPKTLAFVSHGGLLSTQESIYHGVPVVAVPFYADQHTNAKRMVDMELAKRVDFSTVTKESFTQSILTVVNDASYRQNMKRISSLFRDQPETPLDRAIFWTEFALRHNDNGRINNIRSAGIQLAWYQYFLLDVVAFIVLVISLALFAELSVIKSLYRMLLGTGSKSKSAKNSKKRN